jgi:hypothetical protein
VKPLRFALLAAVTLTLAAQTTAPKAAELGAAILSAGLDPAACFRVHDLEIDQEDAHFYLTQGYLTFGKPVNGAPVTAVFAGDADGGDGEVLMMPPNRSERKSLAEYTGSPTLDEHFSNAIFLFTSAEARGLEAKLRSNPDVKSSAEVGAALADQFSRVVNNIAGSFESRMVLDLMSNSSSSQDAETRAGFFEAVIQGRKIGNFDVLYDGRGYEQLNAGKVTSQGGFDTWTSFASKSRRNAEPPKAEEEILRYKIDATLDSSFVLHCVTRIRVKATENSMNVLAFDLSAQMRATAATVDGVAAEVYERESVRNGLVQNTGNELVLVVPPAPLQPGSEHEIEIRHEGKVVLDAGHQVYFVSSRGSWYPNRGAQFAVYDATFRYPKNLDLVSAGAVMEDNSDGDLRVTRRVTDGRVRLLAFNLGVYQRKTLERGKTRIEVSANREVEDALRFRPAPMPLPVVPVPSPIRRAPRSLELQHPLDDEPDLTQSLVVNPANQLTKVADDIGSAVDFYTARFGEPPLKQIEVSPVPGRFGQGFAGMIYLSTLSYLPTTVRPLSLMPEWQRLFYGELLRAHEVAHQWWGNVVTASTYRHEWLMEALANYSAMMFIESRNGTKLVDTMLNQYRNMLLQPGPDGHTAEAEGPVVQGRRLENSNNPNAWTAIAYGKGTWIMHMLRRRMGDAQFTKMLAELRRRYEWKTVDTEQFRLLCAEFVPKDAEDPKLEGFFDQWVYGTGIPSLKVAYSVKGKPGALKLTGTVKQSDVPDEFSVTVPVEIQTGRGKVVKFVRTSSEGTSFSTPVSIATAKAVLDPGSSILRR